MKRMTNKPNKCYIERIYVVGVIIGMLIMGMSLAPNIGTALSTILSLVFFTCGYYVARLANWLEL